MNVNVNRFLKLGIRSKLIIAFVVLSLIPLLLSGLYAIRVHTDAMQKGELERLEHDVLTVRERTSTFLRGVEGDLRFLAESPLFRRFEQHPGDPRAAAAFSQQILSFARSKEIFYEIRYISARGDDGIGVRDEKGAFLATPVHESLGRSYYSYMVKGLTRGELAFSPVELTDGRGGLVPAISYALPIFDGHDQRDGVLVADVFANELFHIIEEAHANTGGRVVLVSNAGYYIYDSSRKRNWGQFLALRDEHNLYRNYPGAVASRMMSGTPGTLISGGQVIAFAPLPQVSTKRMGPYVLFMSVPRDLVLAPTLRFEHAFSGLLAVFVLLSIALAVLAAAQFTRPINALQAEAEIIADGEFGRRLQVDTHDEIQRLAETFNSMARSIQDREQQIRRHGMELEETVAERTKELAEEKGKLQAILDGVPSAFVMLDRNLRILSASRAFEQIAGHPPEEVIGLPCGRFLPDCANGGGCAAETALRQGHISSDVKSIHLEAYDQARHLERIAIPVLRNGAVDRVIEVVTDVTERKEMEARVIQSEKLATTGEMAAVIAHEMRNSLTSVKMILQLELEESDRSAPDREALGVAASSIRRMEAVVNDLLKFARPSPPKLEVGSINTILRESISLIQHQLHRKAIQLKEDLRPDLLPVQVDVDQIKEVFVNLLLNAAQATPQAGTILVATELRESGEGVNAVVVNTGERIPEANLERIFDPFFTTKTDGTGLGLSMARRTVEAHGGTIRAMNRREGGVEFLVWLPTRGDHHTPREEVEPYGASEGSHR